MPDLPAPSHPPALAADALHSLAHAIRTTLVPAVAQVCRALAEVVRVAGPAVVYLAGFRAGYELRERDWTMPDDWHRGWLRGRLAGMRERWQEAGGGAARTGDVKRGPEKG
jgi:hypothetical protein